MKPTRREGRTWTSQSLFAMAALVGLGIWAQRHAFADIATIAWRDEEQSQVLLVPLIVIWLLWLRRGRFRYVRLQPSLIGPGMVLGGWLMGWGGFYTGIQVAEHAGALCTVLGVVISFTGPEVLRQFAAPTFALLFALPVPGTLRQLIALPLQSIATTVTHATLELMGVAATKAGNVLIVNGEQIAVGEACNGMRMVFALTLVTYAFAFSVPLKPATRIVLLGLSPLVALVCNVIRLIPTAMMFGYGTSDSAQQFHDVSGWVMLPVALLLLIQVVRLMKWLELPVIRFRLTGK